MPRVVFRRDGGDAVELTIENFITSSLQDLFPGGEIGNEDVLTQALNLVHQWHAPRAVPASELLRAIETKTRFLPFGCATIDALLDGGLREGHVTELCGDSASGKTQLCLMACAHTISRGEGAVYIDTSNAFTAQRLLAMLRSIENRSVPIEVSMACMKVVRAFTIYEALSALDALLKQATAASDNESTFQPADNGHDPQAGPAQTGTRPHQPTLVVLDSLGALLTPVLGGTQHMQGHALLASAAMSLKQVAAALNAAVLVTNHMVGGGGWRDGGGGGGEKRPALGESWQNQAHSRLQLGLPANEGGPHTATLRASTIGAPGKVASFWLTAAGGVAGLPAPLAPPIPEGA